MANYNATTRTNYFSVKNEVRLREIIESVIGDDDVVLFEQETDGSKKYGFGCYGAIHGIAESNTDDDYDAEYDLNALYKALQGVLCEDDAIILMEAGSEKLRYVAGLCTVITHNDVRFIDMRDVVLEKAREMLSDPTYSTQLEY